MNKIYKIIWNRVRHCYVVVSEIAKNHGKEHSTNLCVSKRLVALTLAIGLSLSSYAFVMAADSVNLGHGGSASYDSHGNLVVGNEGTVAEGTKQAGEHNTTIGTDSDTLRKVADGGGQPMDTDDHKTLVDKEGQAHDLNEYKSTEAGGSTAVGYDNHNEGDRSTAIGNHAIIANKPVTYYVDADGNKTASPDNAVWYKDTNDNPTKVPPVFRDADGKTTTTAQYIHTTTTTDESGQTVTKKEITTDKSLADKNPDGTPVYNYEPSDNTAYLYTVTLYQSASNSIAAGTDVTANGSNAVAVGYGSTADNSAVAIGDTATADNSAVAIGDTAAAVENAVAMGKGTKATAEGSIALGKGSEADRSGGVAGWDPKTGTASTKTDAAWQSGEGALSIGNSGASRQITHVAAGSADSDAVNLAQLKNAMTHYYSVQTTSDTDAAGNNNYLNDGATGNNALAAGVNAKASGANATAVGYNTSATSASGSDAAAFGSGSKVTNGGVAVGSGATASGGGVAFGSTGVSATGPNALAVGMSGTNASSSSAAFGLNRTTATDNSVAVGTDGTTARNSSVAVGKSTTATNSSVAVGANGTAANNSSFAAGFTSKAGTDGNDYYGNSVAVGSNTTADNGSSAFGINATANYQSLAIGLRGNSSSSASATHQSIAIGNNAQAGSNGQYAVALGNSASANYAQTTAIGSGAQATSSNATALGSGAGAHGDSATALGYSASASANYSTALGTSASANYGNATALGYTANASSTYATAVGNNAGAHGDNATALGNGASANSSYDTAIGSGASTGGGNGTALGSDAKAQSPYATALGSSAEASFHAVAIGDATASSSYALAAGDGATAQVEGGVALGSGSTAYRESGQAGLDTVSGALSRSTDPAWKSTYGAISVGNFTRSDDGKTVTVNGTRQIVGVAAGSEDTDAVNVAQLKAALRQTGTGTIHDYSVNSTSTKTDTNYNYDADTGSNALAAGVSAKATGVRSVAVGNGAKAQGGDSIAIGTNAVATGQGAMVIGQYNTAEGQNSLAFGGGYNDANKGNKASSTAAVAFGEGSWAVSEGSVAFGYGTQAGNTIKDKNNVKYTGQNAVAFGNGTKALGGRSLAFGENTTANYNDSVAFGNDTRALSTGATAFGNRTRALSSYSTAWGTDTIAGAKLDDNGAVTNIYTYKDNPDDKNEQEKTATEKMDVHGNLAYLRADGTTAGIKQMDIGGKTEKHDYVVLAGKDGNTYVRDYQGSLWKVNVAADGRVTVDTTAGKNGKVYNVNDKKKPSLATTTVNGTKVDITPDNVLTKAHEGSNGYNIDGYANATAFGYSTEASGDNATAFGNDTKAKASVATAFGTTTTASGDNATAFGLSTTASGKQTTAFGSSTTASDDNATAFGENSTAFGENSTASGEAATAFGIGSTASGKNSLAALGGTASAENAAAIGNGAQATLADSVALGSNSKATRAKYSELTVEAEKKAYAKYGSNGSAWEATANAIAVGNDSTTTRQITGVAAGSLDTDAVNVAQLRAVDAKHTIVTVGGKPATEDNTPVNGGNLDLKRTTATNGQETYDLSLDKNVTLGEQVENEGGKLTVNNVDNFKNYDENGNPLPDTTVKEAVKIDGKTVSVVKHDGSDADNDQRQVVLGVDQDAGGYVTLYDNTGKKPTYIYNAISGGITYLKDKDSYLTPDPTKPNDERASNEFNRLEYGDYHTGTVQFIATLDDGQKYAGDNYQAAETETKTVNGKTTTTVTKEEQNVLLKTLNERLDIKGGADKNKLTEKNIGVNVDSTTGVMKVQLAQNLDLTDKGSVKMGNTTIKNGGVTITTKDGDKVTNTISLTDNGLNNGGKTITNVADGTNPTDAVNVSQLNAAKTTVTSNDHSVTIDPTTDSTDNHKNYDLKIATATLSQDKTTGDNPVETGKVTVSNPKISVIEDGETKQVDNPNAYVTGNSVADAINNSGFKLTASASEGAVTGNKETLIHPGDIVTIDAGKNISLTQDKGKISIATKDNLNLGSADSKDDKQQDVPGTNGSITVNGRNGSSVAINGQDGSIGLTGPKGTDGTSTSIQMSTIMSDPTLDDGKNTKTTSGEGEQQTTTTQAPRIQYKNGNTTYEVATMDDGQKYAGDVQANDAKANAFSRKLNEQTNIVGGVKNLDDLSTGNNVGVVSNGTDTLTIRLAKELTDLTSVTTVTKDANGNKTSETVQDGNGITITPITLGEGKSSVSLTDKGLSNGGNQITHVGSGLKDATGNTVDLAAASGDVLNNAVNVGDLQKVQNVASAHTAVTVNGSVEAPAVAADGKLGNYTDKEKGNLLLAQKKDTTTGKITYDLKLNDKVILGKDTSDGKDGQEGTIGLTGKDGLPGTDGKQGYSTTIIKTEKGQKGKDGKTGKENLGGTDITRIVYTDKDGSNPQTVATLSDGLKFAGDDISKTVDKKLNDTLQIRGDGSYDKTTQKTKEDGNIQVSADTDTGTIKVALNKDINLKQDGSLTVGGNTQDGSKTVDDPIVIKHFDDKTLDMTGVDKDGKPISANKKAAAGDYVTGLDNKDWNVDSPTYVSGRAATEDQLKKVSDAVNSAAATAGKHTVVTVNDNKNDHDTKAKAGKGAFGDYAGTDKDNLLIAAKDEDGKLTYNIKLNDQLTIGQKGEPGVAGKDGKDGKVTVETKSGTTVVIGHDGEPGKDGKDGISVKGQDGKDGVTISADNGKDGKDGTEGHIGLTGRKGADGKNADIDISTALGKATLDRSQNEVKGQDEDGTNDQAARIQYQTTVTGTDGKSKTITHEVATMDDGLKFVGNDGQEVTRKLNETLSITGGLSKTDVANASTKNLGVHSNDKGDGLEIVMTDTPDFTKVTVGGDNKITIGGQTNSDTKNPANGNYITGLDNTQWDKNHVTENRAATEGQLKEAINEISGKDKGGFGLAAETGGFVKQDLGGSIAIKGDTTYKEDGTTVDKEGNIKTSVDNGAIKVELNKDVDLGQNGSVKAGNTTINKDGVDTNKVKVGGITITDQGIDGGAKQITNIASGIDGKQYATAGDNNAASIGDIKKITGETTNAAKLTGDRNITVTYDDKTADGKNTVKLNDDITLGNDPNKQVAINGSNGQVVIGSGDSAMTLGKQANTAGDSNPASGNYLNGLDNKKWDGKNIQSGRAATEDQLHQLESNFNMKVNAVEQNHTTVTVNGSVEAPDAGANGTLGNYTDEKKGNLLLAQKKDNNGKITYDLKLNDKVTLGKAGIDGSVGLKGADGKSSIGLNGKDGISVIGKDGKNGVSITGSNGLNGKDGIDGKIAIGTPGKDGQPGKDAVSISGQNGEGHIGLTGPKGPKGADGKDGQNASADIHVKNSQVGVDGTDGHGGKDGMDRVVYEDHNGVTHEVATMDDGQKYAGDFGDGASVKLNKTVTIKGNAAAGKTKDDFVDGNIAVVANKSQNGEDGELLIKLNKDLTGLNSATYTTSTKNGDVTTTSTTVVDGTGLKIENGPSITNTGIDGGKHQITNVASGKDGKMYDTTVEGHGNWNNAANIGDVTNIAKSAADGVQAKSGKNITVDDNNKVNLNDHITLGDAANKAKQVDIDGNGAKITAGTGDNKVTVDGSKGQIVAGGDNGVKIGNIARGDSSLTIYDKDGKATNQIDKAGKYVTNLDNKTWNKDGSYVSGRAATEDQLHLVESNVNKQIADVNTKIDKVDKHHTEVTVNGGTAAKADGSYTDGNLQLKQTTGEDGQKVYDLKLNDQLKVGQKGDAGKAGKDGNVTVETKGGTTVVIGHDGKDGKDGRDGLFVNGKDGRDGKSGVSITGPNGVAGRDGVDGKVGIAGKDGRDAVSIAGRDGVGHIGLTGPKGADGKDGTNIDISTVLGKGTLDRNQNEVKGEDKDGTKDQAARIQYQTTVKEADGTTKTITHEVATMDDGMKYGDDFGNTAKVKLNHQLDIVGDINAGKKDGDKKATKDDLSDGNIGIVATDTVYNDDGTVKENGKMTVKLAKDLKGLNSIESNSVTTGNTTINNGGLTIKTGDANRNITVQDGNVNMGGNQIHNVAPGQAPGDAVNVSQLNATNYAVNKLGTRINRVGAGAAALAALHPLDFDPDDKWDFAAGYGNYKDASAVAVGAYYRPNEDTMFNIGGSFGGGENMVNAGVSFKVGQGNHVSTSRVAMAKEIKDLRQNVANLNAIVNRQSALIDKLTGTNAGMIKDKGNDLFPYVPANHWAYEYVTKLKQAGILTGYPDGNFDGDRMMTRYEFVAIVYRAIMAGAASNPALNQDGTLDKLANEFSSEMKYIRIDTIAKDKNGKPTIERVRVIPDTQHDVQS